MPSKQTDVVVTGDDQDGVQLVTGVINKALLDNGFTNVGVMSPTTGEPTLVPDVPSLGDLVRATKPHLFHQPITVTGLAPPHITDIVGYVEKNIQHMEKYPKAAMTRYVLGSVGMYGHELGIGDEPSEEREPARALDRDALIANIKAGDLIMGDDRDLEAAAAAASVLNNPVQENDAPTAAELSEAAKVLSKAAHQHDNHPVDTKKAASKIAQKALDAA
ncbi:hypothetical protein D3C71_77890 [compost metagenome]